MKGSIVNLGKYYRVEYKSKDSGKWLFLHSCRALDTAKTYAVAFGANREIRILTMRDDGVPYPVNVMTYKDGVFTSRRLKEEERDDYRPAM